MRKGASSVLAGVAVLFASWACTCDGDLEVTDEHLLLPDRESDTDAHTDEPAEGTPEAGPGKRGKRRGGKGKAGKGKTGEPEPEPEEPEPGTGTGGGGGGPSEGIEYLGGDTWRVERRLVDRYESNPDALGCSAREKGKGYEITGAGPNDDAYALGARNGDVIMEVNGMPLDTTSDLLFLWAALDGEDELHVKLVRDGATKTHHYDVVD